MKKQTLGMMISSLRKEKGITQLELAGKMGVTDKAVSIISSILFLPMFSFVSDFTCISSSTDT